MHDVALPGQMRTAATALLTALDGPSRALAGRPFADEAGRRWIEYRPRPRPGACLADLDRSGRKAAHRLLATALSPHAYAQAMTIMALEEVLDRQEGWYRGRHSDDYWVAVFGDPSRDDQWSWRFEGHHLSVTMTVSGDRVSPAPVFLGANPARVSYAGRPVSRPLAPEEDLARALSASSTALRKSGFGGLVPVSTALISESEKWISLPSSSLVRPAADRWRRNSRIRNSDGDMLTGAPPLPRNSRRGASRRGNWSGLGGRFD